VKKIIYQLAIFTGQSCSRGFAGSIVAALLVMVLSDASDKPGTPVTIVFG